ncbi:uncharacterized protein LOC9647155 [Selaginella moellendorffii]|nr:uncharacterized protein LOC9647155 [Selaginella moellendorffii]XP_024515621.1 uncharacterized protein LOC9647155 [Selaginella moellendorffii]|eukprot:XP_002962784.2 uncharacterized protein LOC9647155 [Selaginella moellendorffii]
MKSARRARINAPSSGHSEGSYGKIASSVKYSGLKDFAKRFVDCDEFTSHAQEWLLGKLGNPEDQFKEPFQLDELKQLDYALEGVIFQQLLRMPYWQHGLSGNIAAEINLAVEDFLHTIAQTLWETLWSSEDRMPFFVTGPRGKRSYLDGVALVGKSGRGMNTVWEHIVEFVEVQPEIGGDAGFAVSSIVGRSLFHGIHMLMSRLYSEKKPSVRKHTDTAYVLFVDSKCGGVMRLRGDISKLDTKAGLTYEVATDWLEQHADVAVSSVEQVWNRFGNANWGDLGALQLILATLHCIEQCRGSPKRSLAELASDHGSRLHRRKIERRFLEIQENGIDHSYRQEVTSHEIQEIEEIEAQEIIREFEALKLEPGSTLWLEDAQWQRGCGFRIVSSLGDEKYSMYSATSLDEGDKLLSVYVGAHPSQLEPSWEDMTTWYQVQRQTRILNTMSQRGVSSRYLPQLVSSGRILHSGSCSKQSPGGRCDHPWCGISVLVTSPVGEPLDIVVAKHGWLSAVETLRCCHDLLSALRSAGSAGIQHGDISPQRVIRVKGDGDYFYVLIDWGRAVLEDRDSPAISPRYSSTYALQEGKLCPAADAESLVYLLYFLVGGSMPEFESLEAALQWRERAWALRTFQLLLGEISTVLKAYADYIDSLIGTPYPADYDIWLRRISRAFQSSSDQVNHGKRIQYIEGSGGVIKPVDYNTGESSGTSGTS